MRWLFSILACPSSAALEADDYGIPNSLALRATHLLYPRCTTVTMSSP